MGKKINLTRMSAHFIINRADRIQRIENSIGWGTIVVNAPDRNKENVYRCLTSTGVLIIKDENDFIITAWIADVKQAVSVWKAAKGDRPVPKWLWNVINYNNNTKYWQKMVAA